MDFSKIYFRAWMNNNGRVFMKIIGILDNADDDKNWKKLAIELNYTPDQIRSYERTKSPAEGLLISWMDGGCSQMSNFIVALEAIGQKAALRILYEALGLKYE
jgi:hypothetical protein